MVRNGFFRRVWAGISLRIFAGRLALWPCGGSMDAGCIKTLATR